MRKAFKYMLRPNAGQRVALTEILDRCRELYNAGLQEKRDAYRTHRIVRSCKDQQASLTEIKVLRPEYAMIYSQVLQDVLKRLHRAYDSFFQRVKKARPSHAPGYPRFKSRNRYNSFTFPQVSRKTELASGGVILKKGRLEVHGVPGGLKIVLHRPWKGVPKTATFKREDDRWYLILACDDVPLEAREKTGAVCGLDVGLETFARLDDGTPIDNPRLKRNAEVSLIKAQQKMDHHRKGSHRRRKARVLLAKRHRSVRNARLDFHHKTARKLIRQYDRIGVEKLNIAGMARGMFAKSVHDVGWAQFLTILSCKAESAGSEVVKVDARGTSQDCAACGTTVSKGLSVRVHVCPECGFTVHRDVNAALNIRHRAFGSRPGSGLRGDGSFAAPQSAEDVRC
jgi:putative transposase